MTSSATYTTTTTFTNFSPSSQQATDIKFDMPSFTEIIQPAGQATEKEDFDPEKHLNFTGEVETYSMKQLGFPEDIGVSPVAVSQPFQLFSESAVQQMRTEIFNPKVKEEHSRHSNIAASQIRGYANKYAPFARDAWTHPKTLAIISKIAGIDLIPEMDYEIGHINFMVKSEKDTQKERDEIEYQKRAHEDDEGIAGCPWEDDKPVVGWHTDSYPFVCVLMLSDCKDMVGGETALLDGNGEIRKVRGPGMGCAAILQGRYITHQALRALGARERITSVTSFRPKNPHVRDDTVLTSVRGISDLNELYSQFAEYRLEMLEERIRVEMKHMREMKRAAKPFDTTRLKKFLREQQDFLAHMDNEIVSNELVTVGHIEPIKIADAKVGEDEPDPTATPSPSKRARFN